jgi:hypothetical protein
MARVTDSVLSTYLHTYSSLIAVEPADENSVTLSFPFHLASNHRIEITITDLGNERCVVSDAARTLGEIKNAGYSLSGEVRNRLEAMAKPSGLRLVGDYFLLESSYADLGLSIQRFLEMSKTIGDAYLIYRQPPIREGELLAEVKSVLDSRRLLYRENRKVRGQLESHPFDLLVSPNGNPEMAVSVLVGQNTHTLAQVWAYKCEDIHRETENRNLRLALIYDVRSANWSPTSQRILASRADIALRGDSLEEFPRRLEEQGIAKTS